MRVLHLAAGNRWTGAAAPALAEVEALRAAGVEAHYAYVGGYRLEAKIGHLAFAHPVIEKAQNPHTFRKSVSAIRGIMDEYGIDVVHAHLTYDHWLARFATRKGRARLARTFHSRRTLRSDPLSKSLLARTDVVFVVNDAFRDAQPIASLRPVFTPPPVDHGRFHPEGDDVRNRRALAPKTRVAAVIGKLAPNRGFELAIESFAELLRELPDSRLMIIGHGQHRAALEALAQRLGVAQTIVWAGYHEDEDLAAHYRAADVLLFTERGSDEGHRAILEAMACGVPVAAVPVEGVMPLLGEHAARLVATSGSARDLAACALPLLREREVALRIAVAEHSRQFGYDAAARRLIIAYSGASCR